MSDTPNEDKQPKKPAPPAFDKDRDKLAPIDPPADPTHSVLADMVQEEKTKVDWALVDACLNNHVSAIFEREIRIARVRLRDVIAGVAPYLISTEKDETYEQS